MKKITLAAAALTTAAGSMTFNSCIGSFALTNQVLEWNNQIDSKFINELVFFAFWIIPVYEITALSDLLVINSIEFWSGTNPVLASNKVVETEHGRYLVETDAHGYNITDERSGQTMRLEFEDNTWSLEVGEQSWPLITFLDGGHVAMPMPDGSTTIVTPDNMGVMAYSNQLQAACSMAAR